MMIVMMMVMIMMMIMMKSRGSGGNVSGTENAVRNGQVIPWLYRRVEKSARKGGASEENMQYKSSKENAARKMPSQKKKVVTKIPARNGPSRRKLYRLDLGVETVASTMTGMP